MHLDHKVSLRALNTFGMEAEARYYVRPKSHEEILTLLNYRHMIMMPVLVLGGGSNILFTGNFGGLVVHVDSHGIELLSDNRDSVTVVAEAGEEWDSFVAYCTGRGWAGLENLSLIPGTVGAAPIQNIGAYGTEVKDTIDWVEYADIKNGQVVKLDNASCRFGYRDSIFKQELKGRFIITRVAFRLSAGDRYTPDLSYGDLLPELQRMGVSQPAISDVRDAIIAIRRRKLPDPKVTGNAGSFFKNPVIPVALYERLKAEEPSIPEGYPQPGDLIKIPAAWLIDRCGWKGFREGDAGVHDRQPLVLVNYGKATGKEISALASRIVKSVTDRFGITLETEVKVI